MLVAAIALASVAIPAHAFVRTRTSSGTPTRWRSGCLRLEPGGPDNPQFSPDRLRSALDRALASWNGATSQCSRLHIDVGGRGSDDVAFDGKSVILWRLQGFCEDPSHRNDETCMSPSATATTTTFYYDRPGKPEDGEILEADIELNAVRFTFDEHGAPDSIDIDTVLVHEVGHAIGLDHTCTTSRALTTLDDHGDAVPFCFPIAGLPPSVVEASMFNFTQPGEMKREPTPSEKSSVCAVYADYDGSCRERAPSSSCAVDPATEHAAMGLGLALVGAAGALLAARARRRS